MVKKINLKNIFIYVSMFICLLYSFNTSIGRKIFINSTYASIAITSSLLILFIICIMNRKIYKSDLITLFFTLLIFLVETFNNYYIIEGNFFAVLLFSIFLLIPFILSRSKDIISASQKIMFIFCFEHLFFTLFAVFFKQLYLDNVMPFLEDGRYILARSQFLSGYNPGFTSHYSTNGIYMSISLIYFFSRLMNDKSKSNLFFTIISLFCLFSTAKRAHLIFSLISIIIYIFFLNRDKISKRIKKIFIFAIVGTTWLLLMSAFVPQILNVFDRFDSSSENTTLLNGREELYDLAIEKWKEKPILGNGWMSYTYFYHIYLSNPNDKYEIDYSPAHNVYLELLCDVGVVGLGLFLILFLTILRKSIKCMIKNNLCKNQNVVFSICFQIFFLLYCLSGNALYDVQCYLIYFISIGIAIYYINNSKLCIEGEENVRE